MNRFKRLLLVALTTLALSLVALYFYSPGDFKMRLIRVWGYFTLTNNPLLSSYDSDYLKVDNFRISKHRIFAGGPPRDGIPSIDAPQFVLIEDSSFSDDETVIGIFYNGFAKAYPYGILNWHEIVNDEIGGLPITVTLCPLCDTNPVFIRKINDKVTTFGTSGKLFQSCLIMYDRLSDSLWSQPIGLSIAGSAVNMSLDMIPAVKTTLGQWKKEHPKSLVMSEDTSFTREYFVYPYGSYLTDTNVYFPTDNQENLDLHPKEIVTYIFHNDPDYTPLDEITGESTEFVNKDVEKIKEVTFMWKGAEARAVWDENYGAVRIYSLGQEIPSSTAFAFVYPAFFD